MQTNAERYYAELRREHADPARQVGWRHRIEQAYRFEAALECIRAGSGAVLDVGCGLGAFAQYLNDLGEQRDWVGVEPDPTFAAAAARYGTVINESFETIELDHIAAHAAVAIGTLTHAENPGADLRALLAKLEKVSVFCITVLDREALSARPGLALEHARSAQVPDLVKSAASDCGHQTLVTHLFPTDIALFGWRDSRPNFRTTLQRFAATVAGPWGEPEPRERRAWLAVELGLYDQAAELLESERPSDLVNLLHERIQLGTGRSRGR